MVPILKTNPKTSTLDLKTITPAPMKVLVSSFFLCSGVTGLLFRLPKPFKPVQQMLKYRAREEENRLNQGFVKTRRMTWLPQLPRSLFAMVMHSTN